MYKKVEKKSIKITNSTRAQNYTKFKKYKSPKIKKVTKSNRQESKKKYFFN